MQNLWQSVYRSVENYNKSNKHNAIRKVLKKIELEVILKDLQYLFNDSEYDCDIYKLKIHPCIELNHTKSTKQEE